MPSRRVFLRIGVGVGALLTCAPLLGVAATFLGMSRAFRVLGQSGIDDPHALSSAVATTMLAAASGIVIFPGGVALLGVCLWLLRRQRGAGPPPLPRFPEGSRNT